MKRMIALITFLVTSGVASYVLLNPAAYPSLTIGAVSLVLLVAMIVVAPACKSFFDSSDAHRRRGRFGAS